jgi:hypothetical protein
MFFNDMAKDLSSVQRLYSPVERVFLENDALFQPMARYGKKKKILQNWTKM